MGLIRTDLSPVEGVDASRRAVVHQGGFGSGKGQRTGTIIKARACGEVKGHIGQESLGQ